MADEEKDPKEEKETAEQALEEAACSSGGSGTGRDPDGSTPVGS